MDQNPDEHSSQRRSVRLVGRCLPLRWLLAAKRRADGPNIGRREACPLMMKKTKEVPLELNECETVAQTTMTQY